MAGPAPTNAGEFAPEELYDAGEGFLVPQYYQDLEPIGGGAYGLVMKARVAGPDEGAMSPPDLPGHVAIKRIASSIVYKDPYRAKQTYREIVLLKQLRHENLIRMVDMFVSGGDDGGPGDVYIVSEVMDCDLGALINSPWGCPYELQGEHIQFILYQVLRGLKYIHSAEVLHRDLKPQNILVNSNLDVRICDFGLARTNQDADGSATGYVTTMWYRAPEVMLTWQHYNSALDMWSVGCIFAEMLNRLNRRVSREIDERECYAVFPADNHVEHLSMILNLIGPPPEEVLDRSSGSTKSWVKGQIEGLEEVPELHVGIGCDDPMAVSLLASLLDFDSEKRLTAAEALDHIYLREFRDASTDPFDSRGKLHLQFDTADSSWAPEFWRELIETEIMEVATHIRGAPEAAAARPTSVQTMDLSDLDQVFTTAPIDQFVAASDLLTSHLEMEEDDTLRAAFGEVASLMDLGTG
eukprot:m.446244 g.446244  ORF g.446244 m.446244 type:complete len:467 (+) comp19333_c0_seq1:83-1483(+)